jgi:copper chaperone NosL
MTLQKVFIPLSLLLLIALWTLSGDAAQDGDLGQFPVCKHCRMDRTQYSSCRMLLRYNDGTELAFCSIHCLAIDLVLNTDKTPKFIWAADYNTGSLIDAETASWVLGGIKKGVMTERAKWAFKSGEDAKGFIKQNGGESASFEQALEAAYRDMYSDSKVIRSKRNIKHLIRDLERRIPTKIN